MCDKYGQNNAEYCTVEVKIMRSSKTSEVQKKGFVMPLNRELDQSKSRRNEKTAGRFQILSGHCPLGFS